jgi:hypothetical protein
MISDRAPNADGWRYIGTPCDLAGGDVHFSHEEARLARTTTTNVAYAQEIAEMQTENVETTLSPLEELLSVIEDIARRGHMELRQALNIYREATT